MTKHAAPAGSRRAAARAIARDDHAVSNTVGAILFFALVILVLVVIRTQFVPVWEEEKESAHMEGVHQTFAQLKGETDRQVNNRTVVPVSEHMRLSPADSGGFLSPAHLSGSLTFDPDTNGVDAETNELRVFLQTIGNVTTFGADEAWEDVSSAGEITDIGLVQHLRFRINDPETWSKVFPGSGEQGNATLMLFDAQDDYAGQARIYIETFPSGYTIKTEVKNRDNVTIYDQGESFFSQDQPALYWTNPLADEVQFKDVIFAAEHPVRFVLSEYDIDAEYTLVYIEDDGSGINFIGGTATRTIPDYNETFRSGQMRYESRNNYYPEQTVVMENGAVIVDQGDGAVMLVEPAFSINPGTTRWTVDIAIPSLVGEAVTASQKGSVPVQSDSIATRAITATSPHLNLTYTTEYPDLWEAFWDDAFQEVGIGASSGQYAVTKSAGSVTLHIMGPTTPAGSDVHDLALLFRQASINIKIGT